MFPYLDYSHIAYFPPIWYLGFMEAKKSKFVPFTQVRPDSKGRITLSQLSKGVSSFSVSKDADGRLLLEPMVEIPAREKWLFDNKNALESVRRGLADSEAGRAKSRGDFAQFVDEDDES